MRGLLSCIAVIVLVALGCSKSEPPPGTPLEQSKEHLAAGMWDHAIDAATTVITANPRDHHGYTLRGRAYQGKGDFKRALADFDEAIKIAPKSPDAYYSRALVYKKLGREEERAADEFTARQVDPNYSKAYVDVHAQEQIRRTSEIVGKRPAVKTREPKAEAISLGRGRTPRTPASQPNGTDPFGSPTPKKRGVDRDAFGLPLDLEPDYGQNNTLGGSANGAARTRREPAGRDAAPLPGGSSSRGASTADPNRRKSSAQGGQTFAGNQTAPESEFDDEGGDEAPLPARGRRARDPFSGSARTPFSGRRTTLYGGADGSLEALLDSGEYDNGRGAGRRGAGSQLGPRGSARRSPYADPADTPFSAPARTPFSPPNRRRAAIDDDIDFAE